MLTNAELKEIEERVRPDCGDNSCRYAKDKTGMRTNGGCRCYGENKNRLFFTRATLDIPRLLETIRELKAGLETAKSMDKKSRPCPDDIPGCAVNHYTYGKIGMFLHELLKRMKEGEG